MGGTACEGQRAELQTRVLRRRFGVRVSFREASSTQCDLGSGECDGVPVDTGLQRERAPALDGRQASGLEELVERVAEQVFDVLGWAVPTDEVERGLPVAALTVVGPAAKGEVASGGASRLCGALFQERLRERMQLELTGPFDHDADVERRRAYRNHQVSAEELSGEDPIQD